MLRRRVSKHRALIGSLLLLILAIGLLWFSNLGVQNKTLLAVLEALAATFLSVAAVSLIYDIMLREELDRELLEIVKVERSVAAVRLKAIREYDDLPWHEYARSARVVKILMSNPGLWLQGNLARLLGSAEKPLTLLVAIPDPDSPHASTLAELHGMTSDAYSASLSSSLSLLEASWKAKAESLPRGSKISVRMTRNPVHGGIIIIDDDVHLIVPPVVSGRIGDNGTALLFDNHAAGCHARRYAECVDAALNSCGAAYENERR